MKKLTKKTSSNSASSADDPNRSALFGNRGTPPARSPPPADARYNDPYAQRPDPYAQRPDPYAQRQDPYARDPYPSRGYPSRTPPPPQTSRPPAGARGYSNDSVDPNRNALFGNRPPPQTDAYGRSQGGYGGGAANEPDRYDEYQQYAQDDDEGDVEAIKQEIRFTKQESLSSTRNAIRIASEAEETGRNSLTRLGGQSEKLSGIEKNLDVSAAHARIAEDKARELRHLNRSMFAVTVSNPFNSRTRAEEEERKITERHLLEREERERNRKFAYDSTQRVNSALDKPGTGRRPKVNDPQQGRSSIVGRSPYSFEEDEEDVQVEKDIDANLNTLGDITSRLKGLALATQTEIEAQNKKLDQIAEKVRNTGYPTNCVRAMFSIREFI